MTTEIEDTRFAELMKKLLRQVELLKGRCIVAEEEATRLKKANQEQQAHIAELEQANQKLTDKYQNLKAGTATGGASAEEIQNLRNRYLAMIREIDLCLQKLNG